MRSFHQTPSIDWLPTSVIDQSISHGTFSYSTKGGIRPTRRKKTGSRHCLHHFSFIIQPLGVGRKARKPSKFPTFHFTFGPFCYFTALPSSSSGLPSLTPTSLSLHTSAIWSPIGPLVALMPVSFSGLGLKSACVPLLKSLASVLTSRAGFRSISFASSI